MNPGSAACQALIAALFIIARIWKQPKCPRTDDWLKKLWYIYTMEYYTAVRLNVTVTVTVIPLLTDLLEWAPVMLPS